MKNPDSRGSKAWFWSGVILLSISLFFWLLLVLGAAGDSELDLGTLILGGVIITFIPIGLGLFCLNRGRKSKRAPKPTLVREADAVAPREIASIKVETKTLSRRQSRFAEFVGGALIVTGVWVAIISLPAISTSILFLILIGGPGVVIGYNLKRLRLVLSVGLGVAAWGYAFVMVGFYGTFNYALLFDSLKTVVPIAFLATLACAWLGRKKLRPPEWGYSPHPEIVTAFKKLAPVALLVITPFIVAGLHDCNMRGDTNPPQVIELKVVEKWIEYRGEDWTEHYILKGETLDGDHWFAGDVSESFYNEHAIGSLYSIRVRIGALGYPWLDRTSVGFAF